MEQKVKWTGVLALIFIIVFFSGYFTHADGPIRALDFNNILGDFGSLGTLEEGGGTLAANFRGTGGSGARDGFIFAFTLIPGIMLAIGTVKVVEHLGGLHAAQKGLTPLLRPLLGIPGVSGITLIASLQSADAGSSMAKQLKDNNLITEKEKIVFCAFQMSGGGLLTNFLGSGPALFAYLGGIPIILPLGVIFVFKFVGANLMRLYLHTFVKEAL